MRVDPNNLKKINEVFKTNQGFDTRKSLNRSNKTIPENILESINKSGMTIEQIKELNIPFFVYKGQLTLHGNFDGVSTKRIGGYSNIVLNANKSLGVKYSAIDFDKKLDVYLHLKTIGGFREVKNSTQWKMIKISKPLTKEDIENNKQEDIINDFKKYIPEKEIKGAVYNIRVFAGELFGLIYICVEISLLAIYDESIDKFLEAILKKDISSIRKETSEIINKRNEEQRLQDAKLEAEQKERDEKRKFAKKQIIEKLTEKGYVKKVFDLKNTSLDELNGIKGYCPTYSTIFDYIELKKVGRKKTIYIARKTINSINDLDENVEFSEFSFSKCIFSKLVIFVKQDSKEPIEKKNSNIEVLDYSERALIILGDTFSIKNKLLEIGCKYNKFLKHPKTGKITSAWICSKSKKNDVQSLI